MQLFKLIEQFHQLKDETKNIDFKKSISNIIKLLEEIDKKNIPNEELDKLKTGISPYLEDIQSREDLKRGLKNLRKSLREEFGFVPPNYYLSLGIGFGIALGSALGISIGVPFNNGIVFGPMIGSGIGLIGGLVFGMFLDKKKESENRVLKNL